MTDNILTLNAGSSSLKFALFAAAESGPPENLLRGFVEGIGTAPHLRAMDAAGVTLMERSWDRGVHLSHEALFAELLPWLEAHRGGARLCAAGHRVVHGGDQFAGPVAVTADVLDWLTALTPLAPLHQPHNLSAVRALAAVRPDLPQVACFDTAFHRGHERAVDRFALPPELEALGVRRYGFHGLSYEYITGALSKAAPDVARGRVIVAHLGNGTSLCTVRDGRSVDTTMGFTALDGLPMGTRCGALDPGVILFLLRQCHISGDAVEDLLYNRSGLLGLSGMSSDMRALLASPDASAAEAIELFVFRIAREIGALTASLGGLDGLVFTAGIGEHAPQIRRRVCERTAWLGVALDVMANERGGPCISRAGSAVSVWVISTDEEAMIARHVWAILQGRR